MRSLKKIPNALQGTVLSVSSFWMLFFCLLLSAELVYDTPISEYARTLGFYTVSILLDDFAQFAQANVGILSA